jgi:hypothetical protein
MTAFDPDLDDDEPGLNPARRIARRIADGADH